MEAKRSGVGKTYLRVIRALGPGRVSYYFSLVGFRFLAIGVDLLWLFMLARILLDFQRNSHAEDGFAFSILPGGNEVLLSYAQLVGLFGAIFLFRTGATVLATFLLSRFLAKVDSEFAQITFGAATRGNLSELRTLSQGDLLWAVGISSHAAFAGLLYSMAIVFSEALLSLLVVVFFFYVDPISAGIAFGALAFAAVAFHYFNSKRLTQIGFQVTRSSQKITDIVRDTLALHRETRTANVGSAMLDEFAQYRSRYSIAKMDQVFRLSLPRLFAEGAVVLSGILVVYSVGLSGRTFSESLAFLGIFMIVALRLLASTLPVLQTWNNLKPTMPQAQVAIEIVEKFQKSDSSTLGTSAPAGNFQSSKTIPGPPKIIFEQVSFLYPGATLPAVTNLSFQIPSARLYGISGPSGKGKSTVADLAAGLVLPTSGRVSVDGIEASKYSHLFPGEMAYVGQHVGMVSGSIRRNLTLLRSVQCPDSEILSVLRKVGLDDLISSLRLGLDEDLGKHADNLSGGQLQRLALARAILQGARFLILDEPTSHLDDAAELKVIDAILELRQSATVLIVTHSNNVLKTVDGLIEF